MKVRVSIEMDRVFSKAEYAVLSWRIDGGALVLVLADRGEGVRAVAWSPGCWRFIEEVKDGS